MLKTILVRATGTEADEAVFAAALTIARGFAAHIAFLHARVDSMDMAVTLGSDAGGALISTDLIESFEREAEQQEKRAEDGVRAFCAREGVAIEGAGPAKRGISASWHRETGRESDWIAVYGRCYDLVVVGRSEVEDTLSAALLETGRPLLVPGPGLTVAGTVAIAWKSTREAARAVSGALPILAGAKRIIILTAAESGGSDPDSGRRLAANLGRHGFATETRALEPSPAGAAASLLEAANAAGAGLLVMGGYGHSRLREIIFGGVTEHMLRKATMPLWIAH